MVKTSGMPLGPSPQQLQHLPNEKTKEGLGEKELKKSPQEQAKSKLSSTDGARLASQAGFQRVGKKSNKGFDLGDSSSQQFSLPEEDTNGELWSPERLQAAQGGLSMASAQFDGTAKNPGAAASMGASLVGSTFSATEEDLAEMEDLAERKAPQPTPLFEEVSNSVSRLFGIPLSEEVPVGHKILAAGLVVAGEPGSLSVVDGKLEEGRLAEGIQKVTKRGNQAVGEAQRMSKGINEKLNLQRTFVFKR